MVSRRRLLILLTLSIVLGACESSGDDDRARPAAAPFPKPSVAPTTPAPEPRVDEFADAVLEGVRGYSFTEGTAASEKRLRGLFEHNAQAPLEGLTLKRVHRGGRLIPAMVLIAFFDVPRSELPDFYPEMLLEMSKAFESATPTLGGLGVHFENPGSEAVAYPGQFGELVYITSPKRGLVIPLAEALVAAESR